MPFLMLKKKKKKTCLICFFISLFFISSCNNIGVKAITRFRIGIRFLQRQGLMWCEHGMWQIMKRKKEKKYSLGVFWSSESSRPDHACWVDQSQQTSQGRERPKWCNGSWTERCKTKDAIRCWSLLLKVGKLTPSILLMQLVYNGFVPTNNKSQWMYT